MLNAAAILERGNASYAFMSTPGGNAASELGARMPPNGRFRLKVRIGRDPICISGKCGCESPLSGEIKCSGKATAKTDISFEKGGAFGLASPAWCEDGGTAGKQALKKAGGDIGLFSFARRREIRRIRSAVRCVRTDSRREG